MGSSKKVTVGYRYLMGLHFGICRGPVDAVPEIQIGERLAWRGIAVANTQVLIDARELFGGDEREGGVYGLFDFMFGAASQVANAYLTIRQGARQPAYRGVLTGVLENGIVGANNPYIKPWAFKVRRITAGWSATAPLWNSTKATVLVSSGTTVAQTDFAPGGPWSEWVSAPSGRFGFGSSAYGTTVQVTASGSSWTVGTGGGAIGARAVYIRPLPRQSPNRLTIKYRITSAAGSEASIGLFTKLPTDSGELPYLHDDTVVVSLINPPTLSGCKFQLQLRQGQISGFSFGSGAPNHISGQGSIGSLVPTTNTWYTLQVTVDRTTGDYTLTVHDTVAGTLLVTKTGTTAQGVGSPHDFLDNIAYVAAFTPAGGPCAGVEFAAMQLDNVGTTRAMNPAHIVYEILTNTEWGMGSLLNMPDFIDTGGSAPFAVAADIFFNEGMGLCLQWKQQTSLKEFLQVVLDHCGAILAQNPSTGAFELTALRGNYTVGSLPVYDQTNVLEVEEFDRSSLAEAVNEVVVKFDDAETGKQGSVKVQNLANIQAMGYVVSKTMTYPGLPTAALAQRVAMRDLIAMSTPLARVRLAINRTGYTLRPGGLIRWTWPKLGITLMVLRIVAVNYGRIGEGRITVTCIEDVFGLSAATYSAQPPPIYVDPINLPTYPTIRSVREASYFEVLRELGPADTAALATDAGFAVASAVRPSSDALDYGMWTRVGAAAFAENGRGAFAPSGSLSASLTPQQTSITLVGATPALNILVGGFGLIEQEFVRVDAWNPTSGAMTIGRGIMGTVAAPHPGGARFLFVDGYTAHDVTEHIDGETVSVRFSTRTGMGDLDVNTDSGAIAANEGVKMAQRWYRPYPPGRLLIQNQQYPAVVGTLHFLWYHRDRLAQNFEGDESLDIGPEASTTYNVRLYQADTNTLVDSATGITGKEWTPAVLPAPGLVRFELESERGGLKSDQMHRHTFTFTDGHRVVASLIPGSASGGAGGTSVAQGKVVQARSSLIPGSAYAVN